MVDVGFLSNMDASVHRQRTHLHIDINILIKYGVCAYQQFVLFNTDILHVMDKCGHFLMKSLDLDQFRIYSVFYRSRTMVCRKKFENRVKFEKMSLVAK